MDTADEIFFKHDKITKKVSIMFKLKQKSYKNGLDWGQPLPLGDNQIQAEKNCLKVTGLGLYPAPF